MNNELNKNKQTAVSVGALIWSFLASSHHWIHMVILMLISGSMGSMSLMSGTMPAIVWFRRIMIFATVVTVAFSIYRLILHQCKDKKMISLTVGSAVLSIGFIIYTLIDFGW